MQKTKPRGARAFLGSSSAAGRERWLDACREAVAAINGVPPLAAIYESGEFERFVGDLQANEVAVLPELAPIIERPKTGRAYPGEMLTVRLAALTASCLYIVDAEHEIDSRDVKRWPAHVRKTYRSATKGKKLKKSKAVEMALEKKRQHPGIVAEFRKRARAKDRQRVRDIWTSRSYANAPEALEAIWEAVPELDGMKGAAIEIITGVGRTGKPSARAARYKDNRK